MQEGLYSTALAPWRKELHSAFADSNAKAAKVNSNHRGYPLKESINRTSVGMLPHHARGSRNSRTRRVCTYAVFSRFLLYCGLHCKYQRVSTASIIALIHSGWKGQAALPAGIGSGEVWEGFASWPGTAERLETQLPRIIKIRPADVN